MKLGPALLFGYKVTPEIMSSILKYLAVQRSWSEERLQDTQDRCDTTILGHTCGYSSRMAYVKWVVGSENVYLFSDVPIDLVYELDSNEFYTWVYEMRPLIGLMVNGIDDLEFLAKEKERVIKMASEYPFLTGLVPTNYTVYIRTD